MRVVINKKILEKIKQIYREQGLYTPRTARQWKELVELLIYEGLVTALNLSYEKVKEFLKSAKLIFLLILCSSLLFATHYVNLNTATEKELLSVPGITPQVANAILIYRQKYGDFKTVSEIYNACWEMSLPVSEDYVKYLCSRANLYAVSEKNWRAGLADTLQDLINPTICYYRKTENGVNYLFKLYDGGNFVVLTRDADASDIKFFKSKLKSSLFLKPIIDWLVVTCSDTDFSLFVNSFRVKKIFLPLKYLKPVKDLPVHFVENNVEIDCYQSYPFYVVVMPIEKSRLGVMFYYDDPRVVITPHPINTDLENNPIVADFDVFLFDGALFYYPGDKKVVKKPRKSIIAQQERENLYEEFKSQAMQDLIDELEIMEERGGRN
jgi:competence protein ComEA